MILVGICGFDNAFRAYLEGNILECLNEWQIKDEYAIRKYENAEIYLSKGDECHLLFADLQMESDSCTDMVKELKASNSETKIVFISETQTDYRKAFKAGVFQFICKEECSELVGECLDDYLNNHNFLVSYMIMNEGQQHFIKQSNIYLVEVHRKDCYISDGKRKFKSPNSFKNWEEILPSGKFLKANRSTIVNLKYIENVEDNISMKNGISIDIPLRKRKEVEEAWKKYLMRK